MAPSDWTAATIAQLFEQGQGRVDDAGTGAIGAAQAILDGLDQFIAVAGLLGDQGQEHIAQVALFEDALAPPEMALMSMAAKTAPAPPFPAEAEAFRSVGRAVMVSKMKTMHIG